MENKNQIDMENISENSETQAQVDYKEKYLRAIAELANYKKFMEKQKSDYIKYANERLIIEFLRVYDDLIRAYNSINNNTNPLEIKSGLKLIIENFGKILEKEGVRRIECIGQKFDPQKHECLIVEEINSPDIEDDIVIEELEKGYYLNGKVIRPSRVKIIKRKDKEMMWKWERLLVLI